jgi:hypothetical protein
MWIQMCQVWAEAVWVCCSSCSNREGVPHDLGQCSFLHMSSLDDSLIFGVEGARDLGAALRVNTTLTKLM